MNQSILDYAKSLLTNNQDFLSTLEKEQIQLSDILQLLIILVITYSIYGFTLGIGSTWQQAISSTLKTPFVPLISTAATFPILYGSALFIGGNDSLYHWAFLALSPLAISGILLACASPTLIYLAKTSDYHFVKLMHVVVFGLALLLSLIRMFSWEELIPLYEHQVLMFFWIGIYGFVCAQTIWVLRPFLGDPESGFEWIRKQPSKLNVLTAIILSIQRYSK